MEPIWPALRQYSYGLERRSNLRWSAGYADEGLTAPAAFGAHPGQDARQRAHLALNGIKLRKQRSEPRFVHTSLQVENLGIDFISRSNCTIGFSSSAMRLPLIHM